MLQHTGALCRRDLLGPAEGTGGAAFTGGKGTTRCGSTVWACTSHLCALLGLGSLLFAVMLHLVVPGITVWAWRQKGFTSLAPDTQPSGGGHPPPSLPAALLPAGTQVWLFQDTLV